MTPLEEYVYEMIGTAAVRGRLPSIRRDQVDDLAQSVCLNMLVVNRDKLPQLAAKGILHACVNRLVRTVQLDWLRKAKSERAHATRATGVCHADVSTTAEGREIFAARSVRNQRILQSLSDGKSASQVGESENLAPQTVNRIKQEYITEVLE